MRQLTVTLITPGGMETPNTVLPDEMTAQEIISDLKEQLSLPDCAENGHPVNYFVVVPERKLTMRPGQSLAELGLETGDKLQLMASESVTPTSPGPIKPADAHSPTIEVTLSVLDPNRAERRALPADLAVRPLIQSVMAKEKVKAHGVDSYRLQSKALGRFLLPDETLRSAQVPHRDHLSIHEHVTAGGIAC